MAERRRIIPASVGPLFQPKEEKSWEPAVRFELTLGEPNDTKCTEFSYRALYKNAVGETSDDKKFNDLDEEDISGLAAFAKRFEEKYAAKEGTKKSKKQRDEFNDLMDVGMGYDDTDPFVDNSECYDELVPSVLTTQLGGFYINQGQLNFREISDDEDDDFIHTAKSRKKKTPHKKAINTIYSKMLVMQKKRKSSFEEKDRKKKRQEKKAKKQLQKQFGLKNKKKSISGSAPTVAELLKRQQLLDAASKSSTTTSASGKLLNGTSHTTKAAATDADADLLDSIDPSLDLGLTDFKMDSDMAAVMEDALASLGGTDTLGGGSDDNEGSGSGFKDTPMQEQYVKCPTNLPAEMIPNIEKIKEAARKSAEGKCKFFTPSVNQLLLKIEMQSRNVTCGTRSQMYSHLASHLPCGKETLLKRAKKLRLGQDGAIKEALQKLREAIAKVMPENIQKFNEECQLHALEKANKMLTGKEDGKGSDDEDDKRSKQGNFGPRRKFQWTEQIRKLLCEVVSIKVKSLGGTPKSGSQSPEEHIKSFLDTDVKPLWPQGWIQTRMLYKETRSVHGHVTSNLPIKPKKVVLTTKKVAAKMPGSETTTPVSQSEMSVASMIVKAMSAPNGNSNQSSPAISPPERVPTLLDYANTPLGAQVKVNTPITLFKDPLTSKPAAPSTPTTMSSLPVYKDSTKYAAASLQGSSPSDVTGLTASFVEKLIADELAASDKVPSHQIMTSQIRQPVSQSGGQIRQPVSQSGSQIRQPVTQTVNQIQQPGSQTRVPVCQAGSQIRQTASQMVSQTNRLPVSQTGSQIRQPVSHTVSQIRQPANQQTPQQIDQSRQSTLSQINQAVTKMTTGQTGEQRPMSIAEIVADTAKAMGTPVSSERQASSVLKQLSTHAQNNTYGVTTQSQIVRNTKQPVVMKPGSSSQDRLKKLSVPDGKRTVVNIPKQILLESDTSPNKTLAQTILKLSSNIASSPIVAKSVTSQSVSKPMVTSNVTVYNNNSSSSLQKSQPIVRLTRPPTTTTAKPQVRMATTKVPSQTNPTRMAVAQPSRTIMTKAAARIASVQQSVPKSTTRVTTSVAPDLQVRNLTPAHLQANMGNIFANLSESLFPNTPSTVAAAPSKELPYYTTTTSSPSGKNSIPKTAAAAPLVTPHSYHQQQTSPNHPIHASTYSPPTKVSKHLSKHQSGSAFTAPSPPKQKSSTPPALSPSTSPVGKYPSYVSQQQQRVSPNKTSPTFPPASYNPNMATLPGYQQLSMGDLSPHKQQATSGYNTTQGYPLTANQGQGSAAATAGSGDAIITGPAPGTFYHQHARTGGILSPRPMQSPTEQPYQLPPWAQ